MTATHLTIFQTELTTFARVLSTEFAEARLPNKFCFRWKCLLLLQQLVLSSISIQKIRTKNEHRVQTILKATTTRRRLIQETQQRQEPTALASSNNRHRSQLPMTLARHPANHFQCKDAQPQHSLFHMQIILGVSTATQMICSATQEEILQPRVRLLSVPDNTIQT
jgi:hypothetical protein